MIHETVILIFAICAIVVLGFIVLVELYIKNKGE